MPCDTAGLGYSPFARRYWGNRYYFLLLRVLRCFSSPRSPHAQRDDGIAPAGLPHSDIRGSKGICPSPRLFADCHVLLRLREPRHPPCALVLSRCIFDDAHHNICPIRRTPQTGDSTSASCLALCLKASIPFQSIETLVCSTLVICLSSRPGPLSEPALPACHCTLSVWRITESNR